MAEFVEVMKHRVRMCNSNSSRCDNCDLMELKKKYCENCYSVMRNHPQEVEEIIMNWAKEHPVQTNADKFKEVFGVELKISPCRIFECNYKENGFVDCKNCDKKDFWKQEYKAPKGDE